MTKEEARRILNLQKAGFYVSVIQVTQALIALGDL